MQYQIIDNQKANGCLEGIYSFEELQQLLKQKVQNDAELDDDYQNNPDDYLIPQVETLKDMIEILKDDYYTLKIIGKNNND
jgi:hypothetical protein